MVKTKLILAMLSMVCFIGIPSLMANQETASTKSQEAKTSPEPSTDIFAKPVSFIFTDVPLSAAMESISKQVGFQILLDLNGLDVADVSPDVRITKEVIRRPLKEVFDEILTPLRLTCILKMGILLVTDLEDTGAEMVTKVYPVADLLPGVTQRNAGDIGLNQLPIDAATRESRQQALERLADIIRTDIVATNEHSKVDSFAPNNTLVITATQTAHEGTEKQLATMRKYRNTVLLLEIPKEAEKK